MAPIVPPSHAAVTTPSTPSWSYNAHMRAPMFDRITPVPPPTAAPDRMIPTATTALLQHHFNQQRLLNKHLSAFAQYIPV